MYIRPVRDEENEENGESKGNERESKKKKKKTLVRCRFVGACDGANSFCSNEVGLKFDGLVNLANSRSTLLRSFKLLEKVHHSQSLSIYLRSEESPYELIICRFGILWESVYSTTFAGRGWGPGCSCAVALMLASGHFICSASGTGPLPVQSKMCASALSLSLSLICHKSLTSLHSQPFQLRIKWNL